MATALNLPKDELLDRRYVRRLSDAQIQAIRSSTLPRQPLARRYGVSTSTISNVRNAKASYASTKMVARSVRLLARKYRIPAVPRDIHEGLVRRWKLRQGETFEKFFLESVLRKFLADEPLGALIKANALADTSPAPETSTSFAIHRSRESDEDEVRRLRYSEGLNIDVIARRCGAGPSTINRMLKKKPLARPERVQWARYLLIEKQKPAETVARMAHLPLNVIREIQPKAIAQPPAAHWNNHQLFPQKVTNGS